MRSTLVAFALLLFAAPALAEEPDCDNAETQLDMTQCAGLAFEAADAALNEAWEKVHAEVKARDADVTTAGWADALLKSQRAWLSFRDAECTSQGMAYEGGSMQPMVVASCKADLTTDRTQQLLTLIEEQ